MTSSVQIPETPVSRISQQIYATAQAITENYSKGLRKHIMIILGVMLYISSVIMATVYYSPSYYACLAKNGTMWSIANSIVHAFFMVFLLFYVFRSFLTPAEDGTVSYPEGTNGEIREFAEAFSKLVPYGLGLCILFLVVSYGILFFSCRNPIHCEGCSPSKQTAFTDLVTKQVNRTNPMIEKLYRFYEDNMGNRHPIASCTNYYSGEYRTMGTGGINTSCGEYDPNATPTCITGWVTAPTETDPSQGTLNTDAGPTLGQFYIMTSCRTCVVGNQYDGYMSAAMIRVALKAGARCLDFDLCNYGHGKNAFPIVTVPRDRDNYNLQHNFVRFEDVLKTIVDEWINNWPHGAIPRDPLFLHLTLRRGLTKNCMDQIAYLLQYYLNEQQSPGFLLPPKYHYQQMKTWPITLGHMNLCTLFNKIVILVNAPTHAPSPLLDGLINALYGNSMHADINTQDTDYGYQEMEWKEMIDKKETLLERSRHSLVYVDTSFHPYSSVSEKLRDGEGGLSEDLNAKYPNSDSFNTLLMYKQTINNDPTRAFYSGCQFIAMNMQNLDADLKLYLSVFKRTSFVLKPKSMWPFPKTDNLPIPQTGCLEGKTTAVMKMNKENNKCYTVCAPGKFSKDELTNKPFLQDNGFTYIETDTCNDKLADDTYETVKVSVSGPNKYEVAAKDLDLTDPEGFLKEINNPDPFSMFVRQKKPTIQR